VLAAAWANRETGLPIYIHTYSWSDVSLEAIDIMTKEGVPPEQICICHMDVDIQYDYIKKVFDTGAWVEFDDFGKQYPLEKTEAAFSGGPFAYDIDRVKMLKRLVKEGYTDRLLLATDVCLKELLHTFGGTGYDSLAAAIAAAEAAGGGTVQLLADATEGMMMLSTGVTIDVNGKTLTTDGVVNFGGYIVDTSADNSGKIACAQGMVMFAATNPDLVVWNGTDGYIFTEIEQMLTQVTPNTGSGSYKLTFLPRFTQIAKIAPLLADNGGDDHGVMIKVKLLWNGGEKELRYSEEMIKTVYGGNAFTVTLTGYEAFLELGLKLQVVVECNGIAAAADPISVK
jgi:hypothetical protein